MMWFLYDSANLEELQELITDFQEGSERRKYKRLWGHQIKLGEENQQAEVSG